MVYNGATLSFENVLHFRVKPTGFEIKMAVKFTQTIF